MEHEKEHTSLKWVVSMISSLIIALSISMDNLDQ